MCAPPHLQFAILLSLIIVVEIAAAIAGYIFRNKVRRSTGPRGRRGAKVCRVSSAQQHRPGQPDRHDRQVQEWHGGVQSHSGQNTAGGKRPNTARRGHRVGHVGSLLCMCAPPPQLKCCGVNSSSDWKSFTAEENTVPDSCCINVTKDCGKKKMSDASVVYQKVMKNLVFDSAHFSLMTCSRIKSSIGIDVAVSPLSRAFSDVSGLP